MSNPVSRQRAPVVFYALSHLRRQPLFGVTQIVGHLQVHPEFRGRLEECSQANRRVPRDASFALQNRCDPIGRDPDRLREAFAVRPSGFRNSSLRISPGGTGRIPFLLMAVTS